MLDLGEPFISPRCSYKSSGGKIYSPLIILANHCGVHFADSIDTVDKAIILLNRKADISCRDYNGNTVLHTILRNRRLNDTMSYAEAVRTGQRLRWALSLEEPKDLLMVFITAGADVYATNDEGETPSDVASEYGREKEWTEALKLCGFDSEQVLAASSLLCHDCALNAPNALKRQTCKLPFEEYCRQRRERPRFEDIESNDEEDGMGDEDYDSDEVDNEDSIRNEEYDTSKIEDDHRECANGRTEVVADGTQPSNDISENLLGEEPIAYGMNFGFEDTSGNYRIDYTEETDSQVVEPNNGENNSVAGMDFDFNELVNDGLDIAGLDFNKFMDDELDVAGEFFDFSQYGDASLNEEVGYQFE